ncbi:HAAS signaling domain-containing protein [Solibacillus sp. FSL W7-1324]|uniref:HAAS signaling domain-containing protein n=1 Tax=Solibacillus sp. FSL W7-1324 TaxID=2921701 RepID=UPI0030FC6F95
MTKNHFLELLNKELKRLPKQEREEIIRDYEEYFLIAQSNEQQEHEVIQSLGSPKHLAKELLATYYIEEMQKSATVKNTLRAIWAGIGLGFLNFIFILGPFVAIITTVASLWFIAIIFILTPIVVLINAAVNVDSFSWFDLFVAVTISGASILLLTGVYYITALLKKWTVLYLKFNVAIVKGESINA